MYFNSEDSVIKLLMSNRKDVFQVGIELVIFSVTLYFLMIFTYGINVPAGLFLPNIVVGCAWGKLLGMIFRDNFPF